MSSHKRAADFETEISPKRLKQDFAAADDEPNTNITPIASAVLPKTRPKPKNFPCPYQDCDKAYNRPARLEEHLRTHTNTRPFVCQESPCDKTFLRQSHLDHHIKSAHSDDRAYACTWEGCDKSFTTSTRLKRHIAVHEKKEQIRCVGFPPCDKFFRKHITLKSHIDLDHLGKKPFPCTLIDQTTGQPCDRAFQTSFKLQAHEGKFHGTARYWCSMCHPYSESPLDGFATYTDLQIHIAHVHPPQCSQCSQICVSNQALNEHIEIYHSGLTLDSRRTVICEEPGCGRRFTKVANLRVHVRSAHQNEKLFVCGEYDLSQSRDLECWNGQDACAQKFAHKASLESHVRKRHLGLVSAKKENERKSGATLENLTGLSIQPSHEKTKCLAPHCDNVFASKDDAANHASASHGMTEHEIFEALAEREALFGGRFWLGGLNEEVDLINSHQDVDHFKHSTFDHDRADTPHPPERYAHSAIPIPYDGSVASPEHSYDADEMTGADHFLHLSGDGPMVDETMQHAIDPILSNLQTPATLMT